MNPIQRAWLKILEPVAVLLNEKLAKRSGLLGRFGKFFMIGPREYGTHPTNKMFIFLNRRYLNFQAFLLHRYSVMKQLTHNGYHMLRPMKQLSWLGPLTIFAGLFRFVYYTPENRGYEPDRLTYLTKRTGGVMQLPLNSMNQRTSAHYIEINHIYAAEMMKRYHKVHAQIVDDRNKQSEKEKKTRFSNPSYQYVEVKPVSLNENAIPL